MPAHLQDPASDTLCDPLCFRLEGWVHLGPRHSEVVAIEAWLDGECIGATRELFPRSDVYKALDLASEVCTGFLFFACAPAALGRVAGLRLHARFAAGNTEVVLTQLVHFGSRDPRREPFGEMLDPATTRLFRREDIYGSGPSLLQGSGEVLDLVQRYLGRPPVRVLDVGCGLGFYGRHLLRAGYDWIGAEVKSADCAELARAGLPHRQVDGTILPFAD
ncbi:MAG: class I SAM-dependent methyltransferase, partial [Opitutaceae bacterium]